MIYRKMSATEDINFDFEITPKERRYHCRKISIYDFKDIIQALEAIRYDDSLDNSDYIFDWNEHLKNAYSCFNVSYDSEISSLDGVKQGSMWLKTLADNIYKLSADNRSKCRDDVNKFIRKYGVE